MSKSFREMVESSGSSFTIELADPLGANWLERFIRSHSDPGGPYYERQDSVFTIYHDQQSSKGRMVLAYLKRKGLDFSFLSDGL